MQGREAQTKVIDLSGTVGDLEAVLKHREASSRKMEAEIAALKDNMKRTVDDPNALLRAIDRHTQGMAILDARPRRVGCSQLNGELGLAPQRRKWARVGSLLREQRRI